MEYYENVSITIEEDEYFEYLLNTLLLYKYKKIFFLKIFGY